MKKNMHPSRIFKSPNELQNAFEEYKKYLKKQESEWNKIQYVGKDAERKVDNLKLPLTLDGFEVFCYDNYGCVGQYFDNKDGYYNDFVAICTRIKKEIRANQITGGLLNIFNPSITQRLNNLVEKKEINSHIKTDFDIENLTEEEQLIILEADKILNK